MLHPSFGIPLGSQTRLKSSQRESELDEEILEARAEEKRLAQEVEAEKKARKQRIAQEAEAEKKVRKEREEEKHKSAGEERERRDDDGKRRCADKGREVVEKEPSVKAVTSRMVSNVETAIEQIPPPPGNLDSAVQKRKRMDDEQWAPAKK